MFEITKIEVQKKNKNRVSLFLDNEFAFGIDQDVLLTFGLYKGSKLTQEQIAAIQYADNKKSAKDRALRFLSFRDRSEKEIRDKLAALGYDQEVISWVVSELRRLKFIDDKRFAISFAKNKMLSRPCGEYVLRHELSLKGIGEEEINLAIDEVFRPKDQVTVARELAEKKFLLVRDKSDKLKLKKRISDLLQRRGFNWDIIREVLETMEF